MRTDARVRPQPKQWGSPIKVADMAHHTVVLRINSKNNRTPFIIDWKSPSAGIDSSINQMGDVNNGFGEHCSISPELQHFYGASFSHDHTAGLSLRWRVLSRPLSPRAALTLPARPAGHMSNLSISTWLGCGVALNSDGSVDFAATSFRGSRSLTLITVPIALCALAL